MKRASKINIESEIKHIYTIDSIVPFSMVTDEEKDIVSLFFIAQLSTGENCIIYSNYYIEDEDESYFTKELPFHVENNFSSFRVASTMIINSYDAYVTDLNFTFDKDISKLVDKEDNHMFSINAVKVNGE